MVTKTENIVSKRVPSGKCNHLLYNYLRRSGASSRGILGAVLASPDMEGKKEWKRTIQGNTDGKKIIKRERERVVRRIKKDLAFGVRHTSQSLLIFYRSSQFSPSLQPPTTPPHTHLSYGYSIFITTAVNTVIPRILLLPRSSSAAPTHHPRHRRHTDATPPSPPPWLSPPSYHYHPLINLSLLPWLPEAMRDERRQR